MTFAIVITQIPNALGESVNRSFTAESEVGTEETLEKAAEEPYILSEIEDKREESIKHFQMSDGTMLAAEYGIPVHFEDESGIWEDIDNTLVNEAGVLKSKNTKEERTFGEKLQSLKMSNQKHENKTKMMSMTNEGYPISWTYDNIKTADAVVAQKSVKRTNSDEDKLTLNNLFSTVNYAEIYKNIDLQVVVGPDSVKETLVLKERGTQNVFLVNYEIGELSVRQSDDKNIELLDKSGNIIYVISAPYMFDSNEDGYSDAITLSVAKQGGGALQIMVTADKEWIQSDERVYPIYVDPTVRSAQAENAIIATFSKSNDVTDGNGDWGALYVGKHSTRGYTRTLIKLPSLLDIGKTGVVISASLYLVQISHTLASQNIQVNAYCANSDWTANMGNKASMYNGMPSYDSNDILDYVISSQSTCLEWNSWDITKAAKKWYNNPGTNHGIVLKANEETINNVAIYQAPKRGDYIPTDNAKPFFLIVYMDTNGLNDYQDYTTLPSVYKSSFAVNNYSGNLTYSYNSVSMPGTRSAINITHYYNSADYNNADVVSADFQDTTKKAYYGHGFRTNLNQQLNDETISNVAYKVHTDADGTKHYFKPVTGNSRKWVYEYDDKIYVSHRADNNYEIVYEDGSRVAFWQWSRRMFEYFDQAQNRFEVEYDSTLDSYYPISVRDSLGKYTRLSYTNNRLTAITDSAGRQTRFQYHSDGRLQYIIDPTNGYTEFYYSSGYLTSRWSPGLKHYSISYIASPGGKPNKVNRATEDINGSQGNYWQFTYTGGETTVSDRQGKSVTSTFDFVGRAINKRDQDGNIISTRYKDGGTETVNGTPINKIDTKVEAQYAENISIISSLTVERKPIRPPTGTQVFGIRVPLVIPYPTRPTKSTSAPVH